MNKIKTFLLIWIASEGLSAHSDFESAYTSIKFEECSTLSSDEMGGSFKCQNYHDINVEISEGDLRQSITLIRNKKRYPLELWSSVSPAFSSLGDKIEWRFDKKNKQRPIAMINRFTTETGERSEKKTSYLVVSKITDNEICVVGKILPQKNQNILARKMANKAKKMPCLLKKKVHNKVEEDPTISYKALEKKADKNQASFAYLQNMGPIEQSLRILKKPTFPVWRIRLRLYPRLSKNYASLNGYRVVVERINLSSLLYQELVKEHGKKNSDSRLDNHLPSERYTLHYDSLRSSAIFDESATKYENLDSSLARLWEASKGDWGKSTKVVLEKSPWESKLSIFPSMVRALAKQAGWMKKNGAIEAWQAMEVPEGITENSPWVEVVLENQVGNGGGYLATWYDLVADDSIAQSLYSIHYDNEGSNKAQISTAVICGRGENTTLPTQMCN